MYRISTALPGLLLAVALTAFASAANAQGPDRPELGPIRSSPAFAEVMLRKTEVESDLVSFAEDYTETNPKVVDARFEVAALTKCIDRLFGVKPSDVGKLTEAVGKMLTRKAALETELNQMLRSYNEDHPQIKRMKRKITLFSDALKQVLG